MSFRLALCFSLICLSVAAPAFSEALPQRPDWTYDASRKVIGGDLLHLGMGVGMTIERARFKAEAQAVRNLIQECGVAHREIKVWDRYLAQDDEGNYVAIVRAGLSVDLCEQGRRARGVALEEITSPKLLKEQEIFDMMEREDSDQEDHKDREGRFLASVQGATQHLDSRLNAINRKLDRALEPQHPIVIRETVVHLPDRAPVSAESYRICLEESRLLLADAQSAAFLVHPAGNLASPGVLPLYNRAMRKQASCNRMVTGGRP